jgi:crotonobetainyl-CoA:carnitine CoA-transferase CaiB-like acyl-CoA transferase
VDELPDVLRVPGAEPPPRAGAAHATIYPYGPFPAGDGRIVMLGLQNEREWRVFCEQVLGQPGLADDPRFASNSKRHAARDALRELIVAAFAGSTPTRWPSGWSGRRSPTPGSTTCARSGTMPAARPRALGRGGDRGGPIPALLPPGTTRADEPRMDPVPALGAHTEAILAELGYRGEDIAALRLAQAV